MPWFAWAAGAVLAAALFCWLQNNLLTVSRYVLRTQRHAQLRIVHLSDLHGKQFGRARLLRKVAALHPDLIAYTGDLADRRQMDTTAAECTLAALKEVAPICFCPGNHEYARRDREALFARLVQRGIFVLRHTQAEIAGIQILGLDDVGFRAYTPRVLARFSAQDSFKLVLTHYPDRFDSLYQNYKVDLVLAGHAHGGQFYLPFVGGLFSPGQGLFPKYCRGMHQKNGVALIVSRGLGNSRFPLRLFNYPEIVVIDVERG